MSDLVQRVLLISSELSFRGSCILTLRIAQGLQRRKVESVVICARRSPVDEQLTEGLRIVSLPGYSIPIWNRLVRSTVLRNLAQQPPDVIHVFGPSMLNQGIWLGQKLNRPVLLSVSDHAEAQAIPSLGESTCRMITCVSESVRNAIPRQKRLESIEKRVLVPGVPISDGRAAEAVFTSGNDPVIGMAGPLEVLKGGSFLLRACHRVIDRGHSIRIVIAGSGPEQRNLRRLATSLSLDDRVTFVDDAAAMRAYLSAMDVFCLPSLQQGLGVIMLEAMALGRPVIASGVGGVLSVLEDGVNGLVIPPSDSRQLAERILDLLSDPERARQLGEAGLNLVRSRFNVEQMLDQLVSIYNDLCREQKAKVSTPPQNGGSEGPT